MHPHPTPPGEQPVDADAVTAAIHTAIAELDGVDSLPPGEHVSRFDAAHAALTDALARIDRV